MRYRNFCFTLFKDFYFLDNIHSIVEHVSYICGQWETCPDSGRVHIQGYCELKQQMTLNAIQNLLSDDKFHVEYRRGTSQQARDYCMKDDTAIPNTFFEFGDISNQGRRTDLEIDYDIIQNGGSINDISPTNQIRYYNSFKRLENGSVRPRTDAPDRLWIVGDVVKTFIWVTQNYSDIFVYTDRTEWNGYHGQSVIYFSNFTAWDGSIDDFRLFLSGLPYKVRVLYDTININSKTIIFNSLYSPNKLLYTKILDSLFKIKSIDYL